MVIDPVVFRRLIVDKSLNLIWWLTKHTGCMTVPILVVLSWLPIVALVLLIKALL